jgi:hypothetical protein
MKSNGNGGDAKYTDSMKFGWKALWEENTLLILLQAWETNNEIIFGDEIHENMNMIKLPQHRVKL